MPKMVMMKIHTLATLSCEHAYNVTYQGWTITCVYINLENAKTVKARRVLRIYRIFHILAFF